MREPPAPLEYIAVHVAPVNVAGSGLTFKAGDSLGVFPDNRAVEVDALLAALGATGTERVAPAMLKLPAPVPLPARTVTQPFVFTEFHAQPGLIATATELVSCAAL